MKYYIATRLERAADHNVVRDVMAARGHMLTYDWTPHGPVYQDGLQRLREVAQLEARGVLEADLLIALLPGGRGTHAEIGIALGAGRPVLLCSSEPEILWASRDTCAFYHHPLAAPLAASGLLQDLPLAAELWLASYRASPSVADWLRGGVR